MRKIIKIIPGTCMSVIIIFCMSFAVKADYTCYFYDIRKTQGTSNSSASAWCSYLADNDECEEFGYLDVTCDIYGDIVDEGQCVSRDCYH